jgi:hypothetical protein
MQGFPRADVDVAAIRADRHAVISASHGPAAAASCLLLPPLCPQASPVLA